MTNAKKNDCFAVYFSVFLSVCLSVSVFISVVITSVLNYAMIDCKEKSEWKRDGGALSTSQCLMGRHNGQDDLILPRTINIRDQNTSRSLVLEFQELGRGFGPRRHSSHLLWLIQVKAK